MSCSSSTIPAEPTRGRAVVTSGLLALWLLLMAFGAVSAWQPPWFVALSNPGKQTEAGTCKHFGDTHLQQREYDRAIANYSRALEITPNDTTVLMNLAVACAHSGDPAAAARILTDLLADNPRENVRQFISYYLGQLHEQAGQPTEAIAHYQQAIGFTVEQDEVYQRLATLYRRAGREADARDAYERALTSQWNPTLQYKYMLQRVADTYRDDPTHGSAITAALDRDLGPDDLARYDLEIIRQLRAHDPEVAKTHHNIAVLCERVGDRPAAIEHFEQSLKIWPDNQLAKQKLASLKQQTAQN